MPKTSKFYGFVAFEVVAKLILTNSILSWPRTLDVRLHAKIKIRKPIAVKYVRVGYFKRGMLYK